MAPLLMLEDAETRALREIFTSIDTHGTGTVSLGELEASLTKLGIAFNRATLAKCFDEIDADRSRSLSFDEFRVLVERWREMTALKLQDQ